MNKLVFEIEGDEFTPEQKAYIRKYAAGLLLSWTEHAVMNTITPDIGDGFDPPEGLFPEPTDEELEDETKEPISYAAHGEVCSLLDNWLDAIAQLAGFSNSEEASEAVATTETVYGKYPVLKTDQQDAARHPLKEVSVHTERTVEVNGEEATEVEEFGKFDSLSQAGEAIQANPVEGTTYFAYLRHHMPTLCYENGKWVVFERKKEDGVELR